jgi:tRNA threonylcarbamoyl adenosine modification protein YeaZ
MILYLDTATQTAKIWLDDRPAEFPLDRQMSRKLLGEIDRFLKENHTDWRHLTGLALMKGPGSFTGLRIGASILNAVAASAKIPIVGEKSTAKNPENWRKTAAKRLRNGENDQIVLPFYHAKPNITRPKK